VIRYLLVVQMANASDKRGMAPAFCPLNRFPLGPERAEHMICMIFHNVVLDARPLRPALRARLDIDVRHVPSREIAKFAALIWVLNENR
jgi:hypothetical protein